LYSLGRRDRQVKVRGFRIELGEVEAAICALPGVALAVCKVEHSPSGHQILVGYFLPEREAEVDTETLRRHAAALLPAHMRPQQYTRLDGLPLGPNHKLDAAALDRIGVVK
jgi:acyl-coenzyme A synthetase/AMP-(fatty) acid ligase